MPFIFRVAGTIGQTAAALPRRASATLLCMPALAAILSAAPPQAPASPRPMAPVAAPASAPTPTGEATQGVAQIQDLFESLARFDQNGRTADQKLGFEMPERAINEYLAYSLRNRPRPGIAGATVTLTSRNEIAAVLEIDFDAVQQWAPDLFPEATRPLLSGKRTARLNAQFEARNGEFTFTIKDARITGAPQLPASTVNAIFQAIARHQPESYDTSRPIPLPFGLKRIWIDKRAVCGET